VLKVGFIVVLTDIYVGTRLTATLKRVPTRMEYAFSYILGATDPVSLTMPVCDTEDLFSSLPPVFETSLPEEELLETIFRKIGKVIKLLDDFDILRLVGRNLVGRLSVIPSGESLKNRDSFTSFDRLDGLLRASNSKDLVTRAMMELAERTGGSGVLPKTFAISDEKLRLTIPTGVNIFSNRKATNIQEYAL
jgi:HipA-like protein